MKRFTVIKLPLVLAGLLVVLSILTGSLLQPKTAHAATGGPAYSYTKTFDASSGFIFSSSVATDTSGNSYVTGTFSGTVVFDGVGGSDSQTANNTTAFITKRNADGTYAWTKTFDSTNGSSNADGIAVDKSGNVFVTGYFNGTVVFDGTGGSDSRSSTDYTDFVTKYTTNGTYGWTKFADTSTGGAGAYGNAIAVDPSGNIFVTGQFNRTVTFDGVGGSDSQSATVTGDVFTTKYNANGTYGWTKSFDNGSSYDYSGAITTDSNGNIFVAGQANPGTVVFDGSGGSDAHTFVNGTATLTKYNANGSYGYTKFFDTSASSTNAQAFSVATDPSGNVYFGGTASGGTIVFDGVGGSDSQNVVNESAFVTKYNANGSYGSTKILYTDSGYSQAKSLATDASGNLYVLDGFSGTSTFDGQAGNDTVTSSNGNGAIVKFNANGSYGWYKTFDTSNGDAVLSEGLFGGLAIDPTGNIFVTSFYTGTVIFDGPGGTDSRTVANMGGFVTRFVASAISGGSQTTTSGGGSSSSVTAPNTGFGIPQNSGKTALIASLLSSVLLCVGLGMIVRKTYTRKINS